MRLLFFGMRCTFSPPVLAALIEAGHTITAIVVSGPTHGAPWHWERKPGSRPGLPIAGPPTLDRLAARHAVPLAHARNLRHPDVRERVRALQPDLIVVACFPRLLPEALVALALHGGLNFHPSLLPAFRGPEPLFWTLRAGLRESGVTAHQITGQYDAGAIYSQEHLLVPFGERLDVIEQQFAEAAGRLAVDTIASIEAGAAILTPQNDAEATDAPFPTPEDFIIPTSWTAERAYTFARAVAPLGGPLAVALSDGRTIPVLDATYWSDQPPDQRREPAACDTFCTPFVTGYVCFRIPEI